MTKFHVLRPENPHEAAKREVLEETGHVFEPQHIVGIYSLVRDDITEDLGATPHALKIIYTGPITEEGAAKLHDDVSEVKWFSPEEIYAMNSDTLRDLDIKRLVKDYFDGKRYPLELLTHTIATK